MEIRIEKENENKPMSRAEITGVLSFQERTPSKIEVRKKLAELRKCDESLVAIKEIFTHFGKQTADFAACIYTDKKKMESIEPKPGKKKKAGAKEGAAEGEAKPAEKKKEEAPKDDKAEEKK